MPTNFYKDLRVLKLPVAGVFEERYFSAVPADWFVIIADIKNSTAAVNDGRSNDVNLVAAGCLIAALNIAKVRNVEIPFFFGGDGGTILVPELLLNEVVWALKLHNRNSLENFGLEMHLGYVPVKTLIDAGRFIKIARLQIGNGYDKAVIIGDGLKYAEQLVKDPSTEESSEKEDSPELNLSGLECRWDKVKPPSELNEIVCYLVEAVDPLKQMEVYRNVMLGMDRFYGPIEKRNPLSAERLKILLTYSKIKNEMLLKYGKWRITYFMRSFIKSFLGRLILKLDMSVKSFQGRKYLTQIIANADTLTIDGRINTVITGSTDKRIKFINYLTELENEGLLIYGHHISRESIMTCYIESRDARHIHFVDGSDGGYTEASKEFKRKMRALG